MMNETCCLYCDEYGKCDGTCFCHQKDEEELSHMTPDEQERHDVSTREEGWA